ncbi:hypothetical protein [Peribacillus phoenicis]|uniref:hypothetical protein n=1 Tax=Peribacillus sp. 1P06PA-2 TaxID=3132295 RepID=UPI0039A4DADF
MLFIKFKRYKPEDMISHLVYYQGANTHIVLAVPDLMLRLSGMSSCCTSSYRLIADGG